MDILENVLKGLNTTIDGTGGSFDPQFFSQIVGPALIIFVLFAFGLAMIASKLKMSFFLSFILALIPIINIFLIIKMAGRPLWWFILFLIPLVNFVISIVLWVDIAERRGKPGWWGVMLLIPVIGFFFFLMLMFGEQPQQVQAT